jgi:hypothetical protein
MTVIEAFTVPQRTLDERRRHLLPGMVHELATAPIKLDNRADCRRQLEQHYREEDVADCLPDAIWGAIRQRAPVTR